MIEADQATEPPPSAIVGDAAPPPGPANPADTVPPEGLYWIHIQAILLWIFTGSEREKLRYMVVNKRLAIHLLFCFFVNQNNKEKNVRNPDFHFLMM